jgi:hypothetical protein
LDGWKDRLGHEVQGNEHNQRRYDRDDIPHAEKVTSPMSAFHPELPWQRSIHCRH